jgi:Spy/CpxP family protein refolding chaperone
MQKNRTIRPAVSSLLAGTLVASTMLASALAAQARPPRPPRDEARVTVRDSQPPRRGPMRPGMQRMGAGAPGNPGGRGMPGMQGRGMPDRTGMQERGMQGAQGRARQGMAPGGRGGSPATAMLRMREGLHLTDEQVRRLQAIESSASPPSTSAELLRARADLMEARRGDGNIDAARSAMDRMHRLRTEQSLAMLKARQDAHRVLTPDQRARVESLRGNARGRQVDARRRELRNREMTRRGAMLRQAPGARVGPQGRAMRPNAVRPNGMRPLPPGMRQERLMTRVPPRDRELRARDLRDRDLREARDRGLRAEPRVRRD